MKKILIAGIGLGALVSGAIGHGIGYDSARADQFAKQIRAVRVESRKHHLSGDDSLQIYIQTSDGRLYSCDNSMPQDRSAPCTYIDNPGVGFVGRDAYGRDSEGKESSVGAYIRDDNL